MIEISALWMVIQLLLICLTIISIITFALIITLVVITSKEENNQ